MNPPIFFSDLDQTLIYSNRQVLKYDTSYAGLVIVEEKKSAPVSFMTWRAFDLLSRLSEEIVFVPTTTRKLALFNRLNFGPVKINHAIIANGARIIFNGKEDLDWYESVQEKIKTQAAPLEEVVNELANIFTDYSHARVTQGDKSFAYVLIDLSHRLPASYHDIVRTKAEEWNYKVSLQEGRMYVIPEPLSKEAAADEIMDRLNAGTSFSAGDSALDLGLMKTTDYAIRPKHGEIRKLNLPKHFVTTDSKGITAAEEILKFVLEKVQ